MKIMQVNNNHRVIGGSDSVYFNTTELLNNAGHHVVQFAAKTDKDQPSIFSKYFADGVLSGSAKATDFARYLYNLDAKRQIARLIESEGEVDVAHLHIYYGRLTASILSVLKRNNVPVVQTLHEYKLGCPVYTLERNGSVCEECVDGSKFNILRHRCKGGSLLLSAVVLAEFGISRMLGDVGLIDRFICVSDFQLGLMIRAGIPEEKLTRLYNFIDPSSFNFVSPNEKSDYYLYFGRIEKLKGIETLVHAAKKTGMKLKIAGTGHWTDELLRLIGGSSNIEYLGFVSGTPLQELVSMAKAVIVPSEWYENCPMSVLEAKATGTSVIGANIGGIPELVREGVDGFLYPVGDVDGLIDAYERLQNSDLEKLGLSARADIEKRFSPNTHLTELIDIYTSVK